MKEICESHLICFEFEYKFKFFLSTHRTTSDIIGIVFLSLRTQCDYGSKWNAILMIKR